MAGNIDKVFLRADPALAFSWLKYARGFTESDQDLIRAKDKLAGSRLINRILMKGNPDGSWENAESPYFPKYRSSYWQFMLLGHLGATVDLAGGGKGRKLHQRPARGGRFLVSISSRTRP